MKRAVQLFLLGCMAAAPGLARSWSGVLVDTRCYQSQVGNVGPGQSASYSGRDMDFNLRYCSPKAKTRAFSVVQNDWAAVPLDSAGNAKAADLVRKTGKRRVFAVTVTGELDKETIRVDSIVASQ